MEKTVLAILKFNGKLFRRGEIFLIKIIPFLFFILLVLFSCKKDSIIDQEEATNLKKEKLKEKIVENISDDSDKQKLADNDNSLFEKIEIKKNRYIKEKCLSIKSKKDFHEELLNLIKDGIDNDAEYLDVKDFLECIKIINPDDITNNLTIKVPVKT
ncbi:MAG TPA: hypothetical protein PLD55_08685 [bacterium]|nr:hypothetical protein [bacterium]